MRPVGPPTAGPDGIVAPRRPVSRIVAMRRDHFDKYGKHTVSDVAEIRSIMETKRKKTRDAISEEDMEVEEEDFDLTGLADPAEDEEENWFEHIKEKKRRLRIKEEQRRARHKLMKEREEKRRIELRDRKDRMQYEAALKAKQEKVHERKMKAAQKKERLLVQQLKYSEEAAERKRERMKKKSLRRPLWSKRNKKH